MVRPAYGHIKGWEDDVYATYDAVRQAEGKSLANRVQ